MAPPPRGGHVGDAGGRRRPQTKEAGYIEFAEEYPTLETMLRGYLAAPPFVRAARAAGEEAVREALVEALRPLETSSSRYRLEDEVRYLIAAA